MTAEEALKELCTKEIVTVRGILICLRYQKVNGSHFLYLLGS